MTLTFLVLLISLRASSPVAAVEESSWRSGWVATSAESRKACQPVLLELGAPWCQACQAMDAGVLRGADFRALAARMILLRSNVDEPEGKALQKRFLAPYTPAFLIIRPDGREIGRMVGWQPSGKFLTRLYSWLNKSKEIKCPSSPSKI